MALRFADDYFMKQLGGKSFYIDKTFVGIGSLLEFEDSFRAWVILDVAVVLYKKSAMKLMMKILDEYSTMGKPIYIHIMDGNERLAEFLGFKTTDVYEEHMGMRLRRWIYDRC